MAAYDSRERRVLVSVGFDGPDHVGIALNLELMCHFFATRWQQDRRDPDWEWLQVEGGLIEGLPVRARAFAVPHLDETRRARVLADCDVVVFVCTATQVSMPHAQAWYTALRGDSNSPIVLQARAPDHGESVSPEQLLVAIDGHQANRVVGAPARVGEEVRRTFVTALRLAVENLPRSVAMEAIEDFAPR